MKNLSGSGDDPVTGACDDASGSIRAGDFLTSYSTTNVSRKALYNGIN